MAMMGGFLRRLLAIGRTSGSGTGRSRRRPWRPAVDGLEGRRLLTVVKLTVMASPQILTPPNGRYVPVRVTGSLEQLQSIRPKGFFYVTDQYGAIEPRGRVALHQVENIPFQFTYDFTIYLQAK